MTLLSQALLFLPKVQEKQMPLHDSAPSRNGLVPLQPDKCTFSAGLGSIAALRHGTAEKCAVRSPLLSNTGICSKSFPRCSSGHSAQQLSPRSGGFISGTGSRKLRQAVQQPGNRTHSMRWQKPSSLLAS